MMVTIPYFNTIKRVIVDNGLFLIGSFILCVFRLFLMFFQVLYSWLNLRSLFAKTDKSNFVWDICNRSYWNIRKIRKYTILFIINVINPLKTIWFCFIDYFTYVSHHYKTRAKGNYNISLIDIRTKPRETNSLVLGSSSFEYSIAIDRQDSAMHLDDLLLF